MVKLLQKLSFVLLIAIFSNLSATCVVNGFFDELCTTSEQADPCGFSTLIWKSEFHCYRKFGICETKEGICGWQQTPELMACIQNMQEKLVLMDTYTD